MYATGIAEQNIAQAPEEEGLPFQDDFIALKGLKMPLKVQEISDALDLVPVSKRGCVEHAVADAIGQGLDCHRLVECFQVFEIHANRKHHQAWLCAFKQAISGDDSAEQDLEGHLLHQT